jgi:hypothetical protein
MDATRPPVTGSTTPHHTGIPFNSSSSPSLSHSSSESAEEGEGDLDNQTRSQNQDLVVGFEISSRRAEDTSPTPSPPLGRLSRSYFAEHRPRDPPALTGFEQSREVWLLGAPDLHAYFFFSSESFENHFPMKVCRSETFEIFFISERKRISSQSNVEFEHR